MAETDNGENGMQFDIIEFTDPAAQEQIRDMVGSKVFNPDTPGVVDVPAHEQKSAAEVVGGYTLGVLYKIAEGAGITVTDTDQYDRGNTIAEALEP